jgi:zinc transporter
MGETDVQGTRQANEEFSLVLRGMSTLEEQIKLLKEEIAAEVAESDNRSLFVLTTVTVLALLIDIPAGLFGINVGRVPPVSIRMASGSSL